VTRASVLVAVLTAAASLGVTGSARAEYCRTKACDDQAAYDDVWQEEADPPCARNSIGCLLEGQPLYWPQSCISFSVQRDGSPKQDIAFDTVHDVVRAAFDAWLNADCGDGATPSFVLADFSPADCAMAEYNQDGGNANVFLFRDDKWPYKNSDDTLALTTITYNTENAQIYDADVEINSAEASFTTTDVPEDIRDDLQSVLTHECGHFLGLSHDPTPASTMYPDYRTGDYQQRTLHADDIAGICEIFPPGESVDSEQCDPRHGFSRVCGGKEEESGCGISRTRRGDTSALAVTALFGLGLALSRVRARRRARR
jgi:hypothetical protein